MIITIDGSAGSGKSAVAKRLAERLGFRILNTGAMYRAVGLLLLRHGIDIWHESRDVEAITRHLESLTIEMNASQVRMNGEEVTDLLFTAEMGPAASRVATFAEVRDCLKREQRRVASQEDYVCEGRDQGTSVFPNAEFKFFLSASPEVRMERRLAQLQSNGEVTDRDSLLKQIRDRDDQDSKRVLDPLRKADDAIAIDTSHLTLDEVVDQLWNVVQQGRLKAGVDNSSTTPITGPSSGL